MSDARPGVYLALVHHPVRDREGATITTSVTNLDVHDIARSARTYGVSRYYVVTPIAAQQALVRHILGYWREGSGGDRVPTRADALSIVEEIPTIEEALADIERRVIRTIGDAGERFTEDHLRLLRVPRFAAQLEQIISRP